ncbi:hypothetical protein ABZ307_31375 [Streptomyces griseorubiginosus]
MQPTLPDGLPAADHPQHTILTVDTLHPFIHFIHSIHDTQPGRAH